MEIEEFIANAPDPRSTSCIFIVADWLVARGYPDGAAEYRDMDSAELDRIVADRGGLAGIDVGSFDPETFDPVRDGVRIMEAQRRTMHPVPKGKVGDMHSIVGGFVHHVVIDRSGETRQRIIHRWPDQRGKRIAA